MYVYLPRRVPAVRGSGWGMGYGVCGVSVCQRVCVATIDARTLILIRMCRT